MMQSWLFQANPKYSQILEAIQKLDGIYWLVTRYDKEITPSNRVLIWIAGKQAGIYAIAEVAAKPQFMDNADSSKSKILHSSNISAKVARYTLAKVGPVV
jgi:hypothetical protein